MIDFAAAYPNSRKVYEPRTVSLSPGVSPTVIQIPVREVTLSGGEPPLRQRKQTVENGTGGQARFSYSMMPLNAPDCSIARRTCSRVWTAPNTSIRRFRI